MSGLAWVALLPLLVGSPLCFALGARNTAARRAAAAVAAALTALVSLGLLLVQADGVLAGHVVLTQAEWVPAIGLNASFRLDALSLMFAALIAGMGVLVVMYAAFYLHQDDPAGKFFGTLMLFMAAMLGIVLSDNLLLLLVFWELTSISSFLLIGYWGGREESRQGARMALAITGGGGLVMLAGIVLLGQVGGSFELSVLLSKGAEIQAHPLYPVILGLILVGCFTKSAQMPFHFWLPEAMAAPTPVSAYLHSATMVKAGLFMLMRTYPILGGTPLFEGVVGSVGLATMVFAAFVAVFKHDLKGLLAYSTISHLGLITFLIGLASPLSMVAAVFHVLNHACFKAALFMSAGIVDHETGTRDLRKLGGLMAALPIVGTLVLLASAAMAGLPPFNGFISKEMMLHEAVHATLWGGAHVWVVVAATLGGLFSAAYSLRLVHDCFFNGPARGLPQPQPHEPPWGMKAPVVLLVAACLLVGLAPMVLLGDVVRGVSQAALGAAPPPFELALWHGANTPLLLSALAVVGGALLYAWLMRGRRLHRYEPTGRGGKRLFHSAMDALLAGAGRGSHALENGSLQRYLAWMVAAAIVVAAVPFLGAAPGPTAGDRALIAAPALAVGVWVALVVMAVTLVVLHRHRFVATVLAGGVGLVTSLTFLAFSAPDLALTQLSVDVASTALLLMGLALLPAQSPRESASWRRWRDAALAVTGGAGVAWLTWLALTSNHDSIAWYFLEKSLPEGGGTNAVNVILVDFRGYDTFGEITVLGIAGVGVLALLDGWRTRRPATDAQGRAWSFSTVPLMLRVVARLVLPIALVVSAYIYWRGHNLPGGGFIAGLVTAVALVLQSMALGHQRADALLHGEGGRRFTRWIGAGLAIAGLTGVGAMLLGHPFLTSAFGHPVVPVLGELPLASAALFDLGVYLTVVGATMLMMSARASASKGTAREAHA
ncbi:MAG: monovalent cation/H+ antiporter subunit A [Inhella sp.]